MGSATVPFVRDRHLSELRRRAIDGEVFDLVVVGGGITGAGVALDAAARGLSVALIERGDIASGTSSKSSKLVHGGLATCSKATSGSSTRRCASGAA